jgi:hypothetical protein
MCVCVFLLLLLWFYATPTPTPRVFNYTVILHPDFTTTTVQRLSSVLCTVYFVDFFLLWGPEYVRYVLLL